MRIYEVPKVLNAAIREHFPSDVANVLLTSDEGRGAAIYNAARSADTPEDLNASIAVIAADVGRDDRLAGWLIQAEHPFAWLAMQLRSEALAELRKRT
ncbi:hypothetical protein [Planobispora rosea]|uniref:hypothetical protein n=1 Tax=Planobispora rosea TaxID=35762 RepID=UPI00083B7205|nr:hypothetical protein [Planobispora rosea]